MISVLLGLRYWKEFAGSDSKGEDAAGDYVRDVLNRGDDGFGSAAV
jgi:hypothetical protein